VPEISVPTSLDPLEGRRFILELDRRLEKFDRAILVAEWDLYTGRSARGSAAWQLRRGALLSDDRILRWVRAALARPWPKLLTRRLELLERVLVYSRVEQSPEIVRKRSELQRRVVAFRPLWKGKRVNRAVTNRVLRRDPSAANRRRAYYSLEPLYRPLEDAARELIRTRNERARALGHRGFAEMALGFQEITPSRLEQLADMAIEPAPARLRALRDRTDPRVLRSGWHPWDTTFAHARLASLPDGAFPQRSMLPTILRAVGGWGFRTERMRFRVVFHDLPEGGLTLAPDPPGDVRVLVHPQGGWEAYHVMFHEVGHAVHSASIRAPRHLLRWHENVPGFAGFHEGIGSLFEEISRDERWLSARPGIDPGQAHQFAEVQRDWDVWSAAYLVGWQQVEQALYRNPDRDPTPDAKRYERRVYGFDDSPGRSFVDSFLIDLPCYSPNYLFAILFHYQIARTLRERFGEPMWPNSRVGPWLTQNWFRPGSLYDWVPRVREVTGRPFGAEAYRAAFRTPAG